MPRPRRKQFNVINAASLARWIVITGFVALTGLIYVYLTVQLYHLGERKKELEKELTNLRVENDVASAQIAALTSRSALQRRLKEGYLKMIPIAESSIVRVSVPIGPPAEDAIQPVVNQRAGR
ncbi:MAG: hypothetical protein ABR589_06780 [Chthoniobacterales bacterium]